MVPSRPSVTIIPLVLAVLSQGQVSYSDVAVIVNANDPVSVSIGNYFRNARSIPVENIIPLNAPLSGSVDSLQFADLCQQIETYLVTNQLTDSINYLVCTKGVPHRLELGDCLDSLPNGCNSFDAEIAMLLGPYADQMGGGLVPNPFHVSTEHQQRTTTGIYLVTRLDGYDEQDVMDLIDRSGPAQQVDMASSTILADISHAPWPITTLGNSMVSGLAPLADAGWNVIVDTAFAPVLGIADLVGFMSIDLAPDPAPFPHTWAPGALASEINSFGTYSFDPSNPDPARTRAAYLIAQGATGVRGAITYAFANIGLEMSHTFQRYLDTLGFNLAESYWAGMPFMSFTDVVIGDPKTSVIVDLTSGLQEPAVGGLAMHYDAISSSLILTPPAGMAGPFLVQVFDALGREVTAGRIDAGPFGGTQITSGVYVVRVSANDRTIGQSRFVKPR